LFFSFRGRVHRAGFRFVSVTWLVLGGLEITPGANHYGPGPLAGAGVS
jgi:hypothetical protein